jgi:TonB family protein
MPAPRIDLPKELALPNVLAVAPPAKPVKPFQPPPPLSPKPLPAADVLPQAPLLASAAVLPGKAPLDGAVAKPQPRAFVAPASEAPALAVPAALPDAPELHSAASAALAAPMIPRGFAAPPVKPAVAGAVAEPAVPETNLAAAVPAPATLAIVGLNPAKEARIPPPGSHDAAFSAGPEIHKEGASEAPNENAPVAVPGLVARGGAKEIPGSLMSVFAPVSKRLTADAMAGASRGAAPVPDPAGPRAAHVSSAPGSRLKGRYIYTVAIQMPNVTSYSGSWIVWFADRDPATGSIAADMRPPLAIRKVDPKYIQTAVEERIEGIVRLSAVILRDGHVQSVELLQHLDARLDQSAAEALAKWIFEPALRDGTPVDVDAVFEIPFRLAPKPAR